MTEEERWEKGECVYRHTCTSVNLQLRQTAYRMNTSALMIGTGRKQREINFYFCFYVFILLKKSIKHY